MNKYLHLVVGRMKCDRLLGKQCIFAIWIPFYCVTWLEETMIVRICRVCQHTMIRECVHPVIHSRVQLGDGLLFRTWLTIHDFVVRTPCRILHLIKNGL